MSVVPPVVNGSSIIIANFLGQAELNSVESFDINSGKLLWKTSLQKDGVDPRIWSGLSYDPETNLVFIVTSSSMNFFAKYYGDGYAASLIAIDGRTGKIVWQFQEIKQEIWDLDMVGPPIVTEIKRNGEKIPAVVGLSKTGNVILVERETGKSIFGFSYRDAPVSDIEGEPTASQQIFIERPPASIKLEFDFENDVTNLSDEKRDYVLHKIRNAKSGWYMPVSLNYDVVMFGLNGGAEWPGGSVDQKTGTLYVPTNNYAYILRAEYRDSKRELSRELALTEPTYQQKCASCHGVALEGVFDWGMGDGFSPALVGVTKRRDKDYLLSMDVFNENHKYAYHHTKVPDSDQLFNNLKFVSQNDLEELFLFFERIDRDIESRGDMTYAATYQYLLDQDGQFGSKPPWGYLTAYDLNTGDIKWKVPSGEVFDEATNKYYQGDVNVGGAMATGSGLVFNVGTRDKKARQR